MMGAIIRYWAGAAAIFFAFSVDVSMSQPNVGVADEAFLDRAGYWPVEARPIPVCWEAPLASDESMRVQIREAIKQHIENQSGLQFAPQWSICDEPRRGIRITVSTTAWPVSEVGRQFHRGSDNRPLLEFGVFGAPRERPTEMTLNFNLDRLSGFASCAPNYLRCGQVVAVHEFMHAIGFLHEHLRKEAVQNDPACVDAVKAASPSPPADFRGYLPVWVGDYDRHSIMNYCNNIYAGSPRLSQGDLAALQAWYPRQ